MFSNVRPFLLKYVSFPTLSVLCVCAILSLGSPCQFEKNFETREFSYCLRKTCCLALPVSGFSPFARSHLEDRGQLWSNEQWGDFHNKLVPNISISMPKNRFTFQHQSGHILLEYFMCQFLPKELMKLKKKKEMFFLLLYLACLEDLVSE